MHPSSIVNEWLANEVKLGSPTPNRGVLASVSPHGEVHSRVVAIREIEERGVLFFTQTGTRKVAELKNNPSASMTIWLPLQQREVIFDGVIEFLDTYENKKYWETMPKERQLMFSAYAPTSGEVIPSLELLQKKHEALTSHYEQDAVPLCEHYCGIRLLAKTIIFYTLGVGTFSEVTKYSQENNNWKVERLSP